MAMKNSAKIAALCGILFGGLIGFVIDVYVLFPEPYLLRENDIFAALIMIACMVSVYKFVKFLLND